MKFDSVTLQMAEERLRQRRNDAEARAEKQKETLYKALPRLAELQSGLAGTGTKLVRVVLNKEPDGNEQIEAIRRENLALQEERRALLAERNLTPEDILPKYSCPACSDEGYLDGKMCECLKLMIKQCAYERLNTSIPLAGYTFSLFSLDYYDAEPDSRGISPRKRMEGIHQFCRQYAKEFQPHADSILMQGATGLGKTHLSLAIANEVIGKGYGVVYGSIQNLTSQMEKEKFGRSSQPEDTMQSLLSCDLLILDDLGTEFMTGFVGSAIHTLINTRLLQEKPTIISTNLSPGELEERYGERIVSRMIGGYRVLSYTGSDVRQKKRFQNS